MQAELYSKPCKICQQFKNRKTLYEHLPTNNIEELKPRDSVHVDLIGPYSKSIRQHHPESAIIKNNDSITCMTMINPDRDWFEIIEFPCMTSTRLRSVMLNKLIIRMSV